MQKVVEMGGSNKLLYEADESMSLLIKNANTDDAGIYSFHAVNDLGEGTSEINLTIKAPPKIKKITDVMYNISETGRIEVEVDGLFPIQYEIISHFHYSSTQLPRIIFYKI
uniref:Immunoglobulin I-set domain-containing protein n=1 Tax=Glossina palpalis gambiensis TaxID=67801 RepID=A0A1B0BUT7_9MUSC